MAIRHKQMVNSHSYLIIRSVEIRCSESSERCGVEQDVGKDKFNAGLPVATGRHACAQSFSGKLAPDPARASSSRVYTCTQVGGLCGAPGGLKLNLFKSFNAPQLEPGDDDCRMYNEICLRSSVISLRGATIFCGLLVEPLEL